MRFLVGFHSYDSVLQQEWVFAALWQQSRQRAEEPFAALSAAMAAATCSNSGSAFVNESRACPAVGTPSPPLNWRVLQRHNPAADLPTDFLVVLFEQDHEPQGERAAFADRNRRPADGHVDDATARLRQRVASRLQQLVKEHSHTLKYAQEDVQMSRALFAAREAEATETARAVDEAEQLKLRAELAAIKERIQTVKQRTAAAAAAAGADTSAGDLERQSPHVPTPGGVGDFPPPQRFDLARGANAVAAADAELSSLHTSGASIRRRLCQWGGGGGNVVTDLLEASKLWDSGFDGSGIRVAIFDTGLSATHGHFQYVDERTNWTDEQTLDDGLGHGTFVAGVIASSKECRGFAPAARLHIFRVFNQRQLSFTSWFLDAFNYAIHSKVHVLNLSIGGPDFLDRPFVDKVNELSANGITVVSAIGNDGPLWGTLNNPADQMDVIGVGGIGEDDRMAPFSSRGMTTWELPSGYGRMKPDIVALARNIRGSNVGGGCKTMSGTSVASPVVAGCVALLASVVPEAQRAAHLNVAFLKQLLMESSRRVGAGEDMPGIFEQGEGKISLVHAFALLRDTERPFLPHASVLPSQLDLTDCPYMWPYCTQPLYHTAQPIVVNTTVLNSQGVSSVIPDDAPPRFVLTSGDEAAQGVLQVWFSYPDAFWPWSGYFAVHLSLRHDIPAAMELEGVVLLTLETDDEFAQRSVVRVPLRVSAIPTPPRAKRLLFDAFHNLRYPSGYFPRDNLEVKSDTLDWNGDHIHTNYRELYTKLRASGYFVEVLGRDYTCFDASRYGTLLLIDPEEEYFGEEVRKLLDDVYLDGLNLLVMADWYNTHVMREIKFYDENTAEWWSPETGGANLPALNQLLAGFGMRLSDNVVKGELRVGDESVYYASGSTFSRFPQGGLLAFHHMSDGGSAALAREYAILGGYAPSASTSPLASLYPNAGRVFVYGDSNCVDMNHRRGALCSTLVTEALHFLETGAQSPRLFKSTALQSVPYVDKTAGKKPKRVVGNNLVKHSKVIAPGSRPACPIIGPDNWSTPTAATEPVPAAGGASDLSALSYAEQHGSIARAAGSVVDKSGRFHSSIQKLSALSKEHRRRRRATSPDEYDAEEQRMQVTVAAAAEEEEAAAADLTRSNSEDDNGEGAEGAAAAAAPVVATDELAAASDSDAAAPSAAVSHVLAKQARLDAALDDAAAAAAYSPSFPSDRFPSGGHRPRGRTSQRASLLWLSLVFVLLAFVAVAALYRRQRRLQAEAEGKHSPRNTHSTRTLLAASPTHASRAIL